MSRAPRTFYLPAEATARALGADAVAQALLAESARRGEPVELVRTGSRGLFWLEPLLEVQTPAGRMAYGPVQAEDVPALFDAGLGQGAGTEHALALGPVAELPALRHQQRLTFARCGEIDPLDLRAYAAAGGWRGLDAALGLAPEAMVEAVTASGLRGRGGAAFPAGIKWRTCLQTAAPQKYVVCNADEGDSGTFADRLLIEGDPFALIEGMIIAGLAVGATQGYVYLRSEYPQAHRTFAQALRTAHEAGVLGDSVRGSGKAFDITLRRGAGSYICGEETSLLDSLEGKRGQVRFKPPLPAISGLFGAPTVINNVLTLAAVPHILADGATHYADFGMGRSRGTIALQLAGNVKRGGLYEVAFGVTLREVIEDWGGGTASGRPIRAVQVGGPLGAYLRADQLDVPVDYEALAAMQAMLGHGGIVVFDDTVDMGEQARFAMAFCAHESCGKCTPCRIGSTRGVEVIDRIRAGEQPQHNIALLRDLCDTMVEGSLCALGGMAPFPVRSALDLFPEDFAAAPRRAA